MQSAQNTIYLQPDCRDFRDHPWAGCGFIVSVSLTTAPGGFTLDSVCIGRYICIFICCVPGHKHLTLVDILALYGQRSVCYSKQF